VNLPPEEGTPALPGKNSRRRVRAKIILTILCGLGAGILACEFLSRRFLPQFRLPRLAEEFRMGGDPLSPKRFSPSPDLGWEDRDASPPPDAFGFRSLHSATTAKAPNEVRILVLGDSVGKQIFSCPADYEQAEGELSLAWGKPVKLWSFAVEGYNLDQYERILRYRAASVSADQVLILFCLNDVALQFVPVVFEHEGRLLMLQGIVKSPPRAVSPFLFRHSHLYRAGWTFRNAYLYRKRFMPAQTFDSFLEERHRAFQNTVAWCRQREIDFSAVIFPYFKPRDRYDREERASYASLRDWLSAAQAPVLDLHDKFSVDDLRAAHNQDPTDDVHPNPSGYRKAREFILAFLKAHPLSNK